MRLIAVRHGETEWNRERREMGQLDSPLTERGLLQADALAVRLARVRFEHVYSSDLPRAITTAKCIADRRQKSVRLDQGLRERHMGVLQGLTVVEMRDRHPTVMQAYDRVGFFDAIPGGESAEERRDRSVRVLSALADLHPDDTVVVVTHGGFLMGFFEFVLDLPLGGGRRFRRDHASFNSFEHGADGWRLETWNDVSHLDGLSPGVIENAHVRRVGV
jgi:probable phosphoglycerate mutase